MRFYFVFWTGFSLLGFASVAMAEASVVTAGAYTTCAILNGETWCWGHNNFGQLGDGSTTDSPVPLQVQGLPPNAIQVSLSRSETNTFACALVSGGTVYCWGDNSYGQLGNGSTKSNLLPVPVRFSDGNSNVTQVSVGYSHACSVRSDGTVWCWGQNDNGELGNATNTTSYVPVQVSNIPSGATAVVASGCFTCAIVAGGEQCWGYNGFGQLGNSSLIIDYIWPSDSNIPVQVDGFTSGVTAIAAGSQHSCAVRSGVAFCWGDDSMGQEGDVNVSTNSQASPTFVPTPVQVPSLSRGVTSISAGYGQTCAVADGSLYCWGGFNEFGEDGVSPIGSNGVWWSIDPPKAVWNLPSSADTVAAGSNHSCAVMSGGSVWCWGDDSYGELGDNYGATNATGNSWTYVPVPAPVFLLTAATNVSAAGLLISSPSGINCGTKCTATFLQGAQVTLTASSTSSLSFTNWSGACSGTSPACTVTMSQAETVTANYISMYSLSIANTGNGSVTSSPSGINCGSVCSASYPSGTQVTLTAAAATGYFFAGWSGACSGTSSICALNMNVSRNVTATFKPLIYALNVSKTGSGSGTVTSSPAGISCGASCNASYNSGTSVTLTATVASGNIFIGWGGACQGVKGSQCTLTISGSTSISAQFDLLTYPLGVTVNGGGTVTSAPGKINCGSTCSDNYPPETQVTLVASSSLGYVFSGWSGACSGTGSCSVTMSSAQAVSATFTATYYQLTVAEAGAIAGTITSGPGTSPPIYVSSTDQGEQIAWFPAGLTIQLSVNSDADAYLLGWQGDCVSVGTNATCTLTMDSNKNVVASFGLRTLSVSTSGKGTGKVQGGNINCSSGSSLGCRATYNSGTTVTLTETPAKNSTFGGWRGACSGTVNTCSVSMGPAASVSAFFILNTLQIKFAGKGSGSVTASGITNCSTSSTSGCSATYNVGTSVTLTAHLGSGSKFNGWTGGGCSGTATTCTVKVNSAQSATANFAVN